MVNAGSCRLAECHPRVPRPSEDHDLPCRISPAENLAAAVAVATRQKRPSHRCALAVLELGLSGEMLERSAPAAARSNIGFTCDVTLGGKLEDGRRVQEENFRRLCASSSMSFEDLCEKAASGWYVPAEEALELRLVHGLI